MTSDSGLTFTHAVVGDLVAAENALGQTEVIWKTLSERGTAGFHVERWDDASQTYVRVNDSLLPSAPDALGGSEYRLVDPTAMPGADYRYRLIEIETDGKTNRYGPYDVVVRPPGNIAMLAADDVAPGSLLDEFKRAKNRPDSRSRQRRESALSGQRRGLRQSSLALNATSAGAASPAVDRIRINVAETGLYAISASELAPVLGLSEKEVRRLIKRRRLLLTHGGLRVAALYARSGADLRFYGEAIDSIYTVQNVYWLEFGAGLEMERSRAKGARPTEAVQTFTDTVTTEQDKLPALLLGNSPEDDIWYWNYLSAGGSSADYPLGVPGATAIGTVTLRAHLHGSTDLSARR